MRFKLLFIPLGLLLLIHAQANDVYAQAGKADISSDTTDAGVKKSTGPAAKERVELVGSTMIGNAEVKFVDASGKVTKTLKSRRKSVNKQGDKWLIESERIADVHTGTGLVLLNTSRRLSPHDPEDGPRERDSAYPGEYWDEEVLILNAKGEVLARKQFRTWPGEDLMTTSYWKNEFSRDGSHYYVYYRDEQGGGNIEIYDVSGKMLAQGRAEREIENIEISPDGSLAAGYTYNQEDGAKRILLVGANDGKAKLVKAEGRINGKEWGASFIFFNPHPKIPKEKVWIGVKVHSESAGVESAAWEGYLSFEEIPSDLSTLLGQGDKK